MKWADVLSAARLAADLVALLVARSDDTAEAAATRVKDRALKLHAERRARGRK
jgi:hypothetical protein